MLLIIDLHIIDSRRLRVVAVSLILLQSASCSTDVSTVPPGTGGWLLLPSVHMLDFGSSRRRLASRRGDRLEVTALAIGGTKMLLALLGVCDCLVMATDHSSITIILLNTIFSNRTSVENLQ